MTQDSSVSDTYVSPLGSRFASKQMQAIWSPRRKFSSWRRLWLALASAQKQLGLGISQEQLDQLEAHLEITQKELERAGEYERDLRHDVMAHIHALGEVAPEARPIIHLGATSQFVNCNTELMQLRDALDLVCVKTARVIDALADFAIAWRDLPALAFTHFQPAQPTTMGRRGAGWAYDLVLCLERLERTRDDIRLRSIKGATGTQASFLALFDGDASKVDRLDELVVEQLGWEAGQRYELTNQTYPRVVDSHAMLELASTSAACHKIASDIRLLSHRKELDEPFGSAQIGSSAMPYKRNPMRCERACGLARFVIATATSAPQTASVQWLERTLDDSSNRRLVLPECCMALDAVLDLLHGVASGLEVHTATVRANVLDELPFMVSENLMMEAVKLGRDRQEVHEAIRRHSQAAGRVVKDEAKPNDLLDRLRNEELLKGVDIESLMDPMDYVGMAPAQVDRFVERVVAPIRSRYSDDLTPAEEPRV
ncbi:MAG: adenylosuccinate lyase [Phycisphaerales bacterium JB043]